MIITFEPKDIVKIDDNEDAGPLAACCAELIKKTAEQWLCRPLWNSGKETDCWVEEKHLRPEYE